MITFQKKKSISSIALLLSSKKRGKRVVGGITINNTSIRNRTHGEKTF